MKGDHIFYREGYKYQLDRTYGVQTSVFPDQDINTEYIALTKSGWLTIKEGYAWDGCSGPAIDTKTNQRGGLVHDAFYQLMRLGLIDRDRWRPIVDKELEKICLEDGMCWFRAAYFFYGVEWFARRASLACSEAPVLVAP